MLTSERTWPTLGWRSLLRHIYRRQNFWGDLVPQQLEVEEQACVLQFLGLAEHLFAPELADLVDKQRKITRLQSRKDYFVEMMQQIAPELVGDQDVSIGITASSIETASARVQSEIDEIIRTRMILLEEVRDGTAPLGSHLSTLLESRAHALHRRDGLQTTVEQLDDRVRELQQYQSTLRQEVDRLARADTAASIFDDIRITHCPACDQTVNWRKQNDDHCFLCGQETREADSPEAAARRLKFEQDQLKAELAEANELVETAHQEKAQKQLALEEENRRIRELEGSLRPFQASASGIYPEELALIDQKIGSLNAHIEALQRLYGPLTTRDALSAEIDALQAELRRLESTLTSKEENVELELASNRMTDGFNSYLNKIQSIDDASWTKGGNVSVRVKERRTQYFIGGRPAKAQLGGTLTIFFLFAYHYALINLTRFPECHYPGLAILDFFPDIAKEAAITDRLSLVLEPFIELADDADIAPIQIIATSRDFADRSDINLIRLKHTWR